MTVVLMLAAFLAGCRATPSADVRPLTLEERSLNVQSFDAVGDLVDRTYVYPARLVTIHWAESRAELRPRVEAAKTQVEARDVMNQLLSRLGETHFAVIPGEPKSTASDAMSKVNYETGIQIGLVGDDVVVTKVFPLSDAAVAGVKPGWILDRVDDISIPRRVAEIRRGLPANRLSDVRVLHAIRDLLAWPLREKHRYTFIDGAGRKRTDNLFPDYLPQDLVKFGELPPMSLEVGSRTLEGGIAVFRLSVFLDPPQVMPMFDRFIRDNEHAPGLILDLRGNPGGIGAMATGIAGYFVDDDKQRLGTMVTRDGTLHFAINPRFPSYVGKVAILVDGESMSTSELLAAGLQDLKKARVFGQPTPGAALPSTVTKLPNGDRFQYAVADYTSTGGHRLEGEGVTPDEVVPLTRDDLLAGRDPALDAAIKWIRD